MRELRRYDLKAFGGLLRGGIAGHRLKLRGTDVGVLCPKGSVWIS
jgi:hypothetical protein